MHMQHCGTWNRDLPIHGTAKSLAYYSSSFIHDLPDKLNHLLDAELFIPPFQLLHQEAQSLPHGNDIDDHNLQHVISCICKKSRLSKITVFTQ